MKRNYSYLRPIFEFNSDDTVEHPWGDFVLVRSNKNINLKIDGSEFNMPCPENAQWVFFHRDESGIIDHLFPSNSPWSHLKDCPICGVEIK